jgi:hypothetical protein
LFFSFGQRIFFGFAIFLQNKKGQVDQNVNQVPGIEFLYLKIRIFKILMTHNSWLFNHLKEPTK